VLTVLASSGYLVLGTRTSWGCHRFCVRCCSRRSWSALARRAAAPAFGIQVLVAALMLVLVVLLAENARLLPGRPAAAGGRA